jgi:hypothetical protein
MTQPPSIDVHHSEEATTGNGGVAGFMVGRSAALLAVAEAAIANTDAAAKREWRNRRRETPMVCT